MPQFPADRKPRLAVEFPLCRSEVLRARPAGGWRHPAGDLSVSGLGVVVAMPVHPMAASSGALVLEAPELLHVALVSRNEATLLISTEF